MPTLAEVKKALRIDNSFSDTIIQQTMDSGQAALFSTIGYNADMEKPNTSDATKFNRLLKTYVTEYVRSLYFQVDNSKLLDAIQSQMETLVEEPADE